MDAAVSDPESHQESTRPGPSPVRCLRLMSAITGVLFFASAFRCNSPIIPWERITRASGGSVGSQHGIPRLPIPRNEGHVNPLANDLEKHCAPEIAPPMKVKEVVKAPELRMRLRCGSSEKLKKIPEASAYEYL